MPLQSDHSASLMVKSAAENRDYLNFTKAFFESHRVDDDTDFIQKNKEQAKELHIRRYLHSLHDKTGRFGARKGAEANDSISELAESGDKPGDVYFDPLGLKVIVEDPDIDEDDPDYEDAAKIEDDFVNRVDSEILLNRENDFEAHRSDEDTLYSQLALGQMISEGEKSGRLDLDRFASSYDAGRAFVADEEVPNKIPDDFELELMIDDPPPKYSQEYVQYDADQNKGIKAHIKHFFRKMIRRKDPDENTTKDRFIKSLPEYKRIYSEGEEAVRKANKNVKGKAKTKYDPKLDSRLNDFVNKTMAALDSQSTGHASVSLNAKKLGGTVSKYSFGLRSTANPGMAGTVKGEIANPDRPDFNPLVSTYNIKYADYLKAAAKVRGTVGSMRTYTTIGYNCTSFATEVAQAAGIPLKPEDSASYLMTHRHYSQLVDSPYTLAAHLTERNEGLKKANEEDPVESAITADINTKTAAYLNTYRAGILNMPLIQTLKRRGLVKDEKIEEKIAAVIRGEVQKAADVERAVPIDGLEGEALEAAMKRRQEGTNIAFHDFPDVGEYLAALCTQEDPFVQSMMTTDMIEEFDTLAGATLRKADKQYWIKQFLRSDYYLRHFRFLQPLTAFNLTDRLISIIIDKQHQISDNVSAAFLSASWPDRIRNIDSALGQYDFNLLGSKIFDSEQNLSRFLAISGLDEFGNQIVQKAEAEEDKKNQQRKDKDEEAAAALATAAQPQTETVSKTDQAEANQTDSEKPTAAEEAKEVETTADTSALPATETEVRVETEPPKETAAEPAGGTAQTEVSKEVIEAAVTPAKETETAVTPAKETETAVTPAKETEAAPAPANKTEAETEVRAPREVENLSIKNMIFAMDDYNACEGFKTALSKVTNISGYMIESGARITRADIVRFLSRLAEDSAIPPGLLNGAELAVTYSPIPSRQFSFIKSLEAIIKMSSKSTITKTLNDLGMS